MNQFGGDWTKTKIEILVEYAKAYLKIMNKYPQYRILYFDGFAGTSFIINGKPEHPEITIGAARRIVEINEPKGFDGYYFVEKDVAKCEQLESATRKAFPDKEIYIVQKDCNDKLEALAEHLNKPKTYREYDKVLAYIDPCGMQLDWESVEALKGIGADVWVLVPTGMGVNRLLKRNGQISEPWVLKLEKFLGMGEGEIREYFFREEIEWTLFGEQKRITKEEKAIEKAAKLYKERLGTVFRFVTNPLPLINEKNSTMYHLIFMSNNIAAQNIANDIIKKYRQ